MGKHFSIAVIVLSISLFFSVRMNAQKDSVSTEIRRNLVFLELGGNVVEQVFFCNDFRNCHWWANFSINYDRIFHLGRNKFFSIRIGTSFPFKGELLIIPVLFNCSFGHRRMKFEAGLGPEAIITTANDPKFYKAVSALLGLRYYCAKERLAIRAGVTPTLGLVGGLYSGAKFGFSLGYVF